MEYWWFEIEMETINEVNTLQRPSTHTCFNLQLYLQTLCIKGAWKSHKNS
jgi:hypothetical protein